MNESSSDSPHTGSPIFYIIRIEGHLSPTWEEWLDPLTITPERDGTTILYGPLPDQSAMVGLISRLHGGNIRILKIERLISI